MVNFFLNKLNRKKSEGMTLVEILIMVGIISILIILAVAFLKNKIFKAIDAKRKSDIARIQVAVEEYEKDHDCYPPPELVVCSPGTGLQSYLNKIPCDPSTKASYYYEYQDSACPRWYRIYTILDDSTDSDISKKGCSYGCGSNYVYNYYSSSPNAPKPPAGSPPTPTPSASPGGGGDGNGSGFYGCKAGVCTPIGWDPTRPGPECDPNYQNSTCYGQCASAQNECVPWHK